MTHTYNGDAVMACGHTELQHQETGGLVWCISAFTLHGGREIRLSDALDTQTLERIDSYDWDGSAMIHEDAIEVVAWATHRYRIALRDALALIDELKDGHKGQWSVPEVMRLAEICALVEP
jgi:hypothetical protein